LGAPRRSSALLVVVVGIALWLLLPQVPAAHIHTVTLRLPPPSGTPAIRVGGELPVHPIAPGFVGLSFDYTALTAYAGASAGAVDPVLVALIRNASGRRARRTGESGSC
jgi:hypothetical protein